MGLFNFAAEDQKDYFISGCGRTGIEKAIE